MPVSKVIQREVFNASGPATADCAEAFAPGPDQAGLSMWSKGLRWIERRSSDWDIGRKSSALCLPLLLFSKCI